MKLCSIIYNISDILLRDISVVFEVSCFSYLVSVRIVYCVSLFICLECFIWLYMFCAEFFSAIVKAIGYSF